jgi:uncharacterized OB-fold protein
MDQTQSAELKPATSYLKFDVAGAPFLEGARCAACGATYVGAREACSRCFARDRMEPIALADRGRLYNWTVVYRSLPGVRTPFVSAIVDLDGGGALKGNLVDFPADPQVLRFDMPVRVVFRGAETAVAGGEGFLAHFFVPQEQGAAS